MWGSSASAQEAGGARHSVAWDRYYPVDVNRSQSAAQDTGFNKQTISQLLKELEDAEKTSKNQTVRDLRDKLNKIREELGDEKFKEILEELKKGRTDAWWEWLKAMFPGLFPDERPPAPPSQAPSPRGTGGVRVNPQDFGPSEAMSNKPITEGANYFNYKPDNSDPGRKPDNIWSGFSQGPDGNCITVSAIKAAMMQFGQKPTDVFKEVKETSNGYEVMMRDGFKLSLTKDELRQAATHARFRGDDPAMMTDANFMYAASAKRAQIENNDGWAGRSFQAAMNSLNDGEFAREGLDRLGLRGHYRPATDADLRSSKVGTVEYGNHSMAVINGRVELWGRRGGAPRSGIATVLF
ncbi:hypothetical protein [Pseudomonas sp. NFPP28]|uniref:hypothetical protein n=1 Tax=Pseudomonas sp. NFPP28 TaxID=1566231 RepID=UPI0008E70403|nr:hypothetical protein [Pseudomonas sp. NFPP28]SFQ04213.1 hypothetical protein SAMN03159315_05577 [Pseudomonas sp. NFPP28]